MRTKAQIKYFLPGFLHVPSLEVFKARLDEALSNLVWKVSLPMAGGVGAR